MKQKFVCAMVAAMLSSGCKAEQDDIMNAFEKALSDRDVIACQTNLAPVFQKADSGGYFADPEKRDKIMVMVSSRILDKRINIDDSMIWTRCDRMESLMLQIAQYDVISQTNSIFLKLADYLSAVNIDPMTNLLEEAKIAREMDRTLIATGAIERPVVNTGFPRTPKLRALREKYNRIRNWNAMVNNHRQRVAYFFSKPLEQYLRSLKKEDAEAFRKLFTERAGLSKEEENLFFPKGKDE
ncbi:MAG: hypothetical protein IJR99_15185 [Kiritimatiellae bacterium]|nr:hypothetical protein [Kiritimatiellia bacterium]